MGYLETALAIWGDCNGIKNAPMTDLLEAYEVRRTKSRTEAEDPPSDPDDWPETWRSDFAEMRAENVRLGYPPGEAAHLAYLVLKSRAACPWRATVATWPLELRRRWGERAGELQDGGDDWRDAERIAFDEVEGRGDEAAEAESESESDIWTMPVHLGKPRKRRGGLIAYGGGGPR
jgi:hypothetical protein